MVEEGVNVFVATIVIQAANLVKQSGNSVEGAQRLPSRWQKSHPTSLGRVKYS
jgi:hypothetical protein